MLYVTGVRYKDNNMLGVEVCGEELAMDFNYIPLEIEITDSCNEEVRTYSGVALNSLIKSSKNILGCLYFPREDGIIELHCGVYDEKQLHLLSYCTNWKARVLKDTKVPYMPEHYMSEYHPYYDYSVLENLGLDDFVNYSKYFALEAVGVHNIKGFDILVIMLKDVCNLGFKLNVPAIDSIISLEYKNLKNVSLPTDVGYFDMKFSDKFTGELAKYMLLYKNSSHMLVNVDLGLIKA